jgi:hypothetical protein
MAATATPKNPKVVTVYGPLSFPNFTMAQAIARNTGSQYAKKPEDVAPDFNLLLEQGQHDKFVAHVKDHFLPYCIEQGLKGERDGLTEAEVKKILKVLESDLEDQPPYIALKPVNPKTQVLAPLAVSSLKVVGNKGQDIELRAIVEDESQLSVPDPDRMEWPAVYPIGKTMHSMYAGCYVAATCNLYAFVSGKLPGFSASAAVAVFKTDGERFGGGVQVDEDEIFAD